MKPASLSGPVNMKCASGSFKIHFLTVFFVLILINQAAGQESRIIKPGNFTGIHVSSGIDAELILATEPSVEVNFNNVSTSQLVTEVKNGILRLKMKTGKYMQGDLKVKIFYKDDLTAISSDRRANIWSDEEIYMSHAVINLSNGGSIRLKIQCGQLTAELSQGSIFVVNGTVKSLDLKVATVATFSGYGLQVENADILANSGGKAKVSVSHYLNGKAISGGWIGYLSDPEKIDSKVSFKGEIVRTYIDE